MNPDDPASFLRDPFPNNAIPGARLDPLATNYFENYYDRPNIDNPAFNVINTRPQQSDNNTMQIKLDHRLGDADSMWFRYSQLNNPQTLPATVKNGRIFSNRPRNIAGGWVHLVGTNVVFDTKFGWVREALNTEADLAAGLGPLQSDGWVGLDEFGAPGMGLQAPLRRARSQHAAPGDGLAVDVQRGRQLDQGQPQLQVRRDVHLAGAGRTHDPAQHPVQQRADRGSAEPGNDRKLSGLGPARLPSPVHDPQPELQHHLAEPPACTSRTNGRPPIGSQ